MAAAAAAGATVALCGLPATAAAHIAPPVVVDGPSAAIAELGGVAMAPDGSGGAIYRRVDASGSHIYCARYVNGRWGMPRRVDTSLPYDSSWPRIAAGDGGRLLAVWVQEYAHRGSTPLYRLQSAAIGPGASWFGRVVGVDQNVGASDGSVSQLFPSLAMSRSGAAYVAYRVVTTPRIIGGAQTAPPAHPGDTVAQFRLARWNGLTWSSGGMLNRNPSFSVPAATAVNSPRVAIDDEGDAVAAFLEPDDGGVERVWVRRVFDTRLGLVQEASPTTFGGKPVLGDADAFDLAIGDLGPVAVVVRQQPGVPSALPGPRLFVNTMPQTQDADGAKMRGATLLPSPGAAADLKLGGAAVALDGDEDLAVAYGAGGALRLAAGTPDGIADAGALDPGGAQPGQPAIAIDPDGGTAVVWPALSGGAFGVGIAERREGGVAGSGVVAGPSGGPVGELAVGPSGLGDALVAFRQGTGTRSEIVASAVVGPPRPPTIEAPTDWVRPRAARITWSAAGSGAGKVTYAVALNGQVKRRGLTQRRFRPDPRGLDDGVYHVVVIATDAFGQQRRNRISADLKVDGRPPVVRVRIARSRLTVRVSDGPRGRVSGAVRSATTVRFGDGTRGRGLVLRHRYRQPGRYTVIVATRDAAGNRARTVTKVRAR